MRHAFRPAALPILLAAALAPMGAPAAAQHPGCMSQSQTAAAVRDGKVKPFEQVVPPVMRRPPGFLGVRLCEYEGRPVYVVSTLGKRGEVSHTVVDAVSGAVLRN